MQDASDRTRAFSVITALLAEDTPLAEKLILEDQDPQALAWSAATIAAGLWEHHANKMDLEPKVAWAECLLRIQQ